MTEAVVFYALAALSIGGAVGVVASKRAMYSAMSLIWTLFCVASLFVLLRAHLLAALQVLVYAGAIMMLFVFVIMLLSAADEEERNVRRTGYGLLGLMAAFGLIVTVSWAASQEPLAEGPPIVGTARAVALNLYTEHVLAFQVTAVLLLTAIVGATVLAVRRL